LLTTADIIVLLFDGRRVPRPLADLPTVHVGGTSDIDAAIPTSRRLVVVGGDADLAAVLTRLLRTDRLDVELGHVPRWRSARRARTGAAQRVPLIRDDTGTAITKAAYWLPPQEQRTIHGEAVVDDTVLFDGEVTGVRIEPTLTAPGLQAAVLSSRMRPRTWVTGRAAQLGTTGALMVRDGVAASRPVRRSTFYRHIEGWLQVR
jgi:hypothetical protein